MARARILEFLLLTTTLIYSISCNKNPHEMKSNSDENSVSSQEDYETTSLTGDLCFKDVIYQLIKTKHELKTDRRISTTTSTPLPLSSASNKKNGHESEFFRSGFDRIAVEGKGPSIARNLAGHRPKITPKRAPVSGLVSGICMFNCSHEEKTTTLRKTFQPTLLVQLSVYLHVHELTLATHEENKDRCIWLGRNLFLNGIRATCTTFKRLGGYYPTLALIASETVVHFAENLLEHRKDEGKHISEKLQKLGKQITTNELSITNIVAILFSPKVVLKPPDARMHYIVVQTKANGVEIKEVFTFGPDSSIPAEEVVAMWTPRKGIDSPFMRTHLLAPKDFMGNVIRVAYAESYPDAFQELDKSNETVVRGYSVDIINLLQKQLNFTVKWKMAPDNEFGVPNENGTFSGVVGILQRKEADIALPGLNINADRSRVIDFSAAIGFGELRLLIFRSSKIEAIQWSTYFGGFEWRVWVIIVCVWLTMSIGLVIVSRPDPDISVYNYLFIFLGAIAQQGSPIEPRCGRGRVVFLSFWAGSLILYTSYTASLTSQLTWVYSEDPFTSLGGALTKAGYSVIIRSGTGYISSVKELRGKDQSMDMLYRQWKSKPELLVKDDNAAVMLLKSKEKYAYFKYTKEVSPYMKDNCSFTWVGQAYFPEYTYLGFMKNLSYANIISQSIAKAASAGLLSKLALKYWGNEPTCRKTGFQQLGFSKVLSAFFLLFMGVVLAVLFHIAEVMLHRCLSRRNNTQGRLHSHRRRRMRVKGRHSWKTIEVTPYEPHLKARFSQRGEKF